jgi:hypothetical protein
MSDFLFAMGWGLFCGSLVACAALMYLLRAKDQEIAMLRQPHRLRKYVLDNAPSLHR